MKLYKSQCLQYEKKLIKALLKREDVWTGADDLISGGDWDALEETGREHNIEKLIYLADAPIE